MRKAVRTYGHIFFDKENQHWVVDQAEPHICIKLKAVFPKIYQGKVLPYKFLECPEVCHDLIWFMDRYPLSISKTDLGHLKRKKKAHIDELNELETLLLPDYRPSAVVLNPGKEARHYQIIGADVAHRAHRILIGDDIGLGKTLTSILLTLKPGTLPAIVVVQAHLPPQWKAEIEKFTNLEVHAIKGTKPYSLPPADIYIIKYTCLRGWVDIFQKKIAKTCIFDEVQELRHMDTDKYHGAKILSANSKYCIGLSATPIYNYGNEIFSVMNIIKDGCLGAYYDFMREWTDGWKIVKDPKALGTYLRENFLMLRRTRADVSMELPTINKIIHYVNYDEKEVVKAEDLAKKLAIQVTSGSFMERGQAARELDILIRHMTGVSKAKEVAEFVKILLENNEPIVLAGWHREVYEIWQRELEAYKPVMYTGSESPAQKEASKKAFINGETNLFIISLRSGIGLDGLQKRSKIVVIGELDWSPKVHDQLIGRLDRDGQQEQVTAMYLVSNYGSDPLIIDMLGLKSSQSHNIIDPLTAVSEQYSDESRMKLLAQKFLEKTKTTTI